MKPPSKLKNNGIRFVLLKPKDKIPIEKEWQKKNIFWDDEHLTSHTGNYGVMGGGDKKLIIVDFDSEDIQNKVIDKLPETFTVKTGGGLLHKYFFSDGCESFKVFDEDMNTLADIQGEGKQVVGPGSIHPNGNAYEIFDNSDIGFINYAEIKAIMMAHDKKPRKETIKSTIEQLPKGDDNFMDTIKSQVKIKDLLSEFGSNTDMNPTNCPFHDSKGGKCLGFTDEVAHCFHCDDSWNIFSLVMQHKNYDFTEALDWLADRQGLKKELKENRKDWGVKQLPVVKFTPKTETNEELKTNVVNLILGRHEDDATELITQKIKEDNHIYTTRDDIKSEIWIYDDGIYKPNGKSYIQEIIREYLGAAYTPQRSNKIIAKIEVDTMVDTTIFFSSAYLNEICLENGILNLETQELSAFTPDKIFFNKIPVEYNIDATCPSIDKFFGDILKEEEDKIVLYELVGFCLHKDYFLEKAFMFVGDGRNGKGKTLSLIKNFLGTENTCSVRLSQMEPQNTALCELHNRLVNLAGDLNNTALKDTGLFKELTGRDSVQVKRKYLRDLIFTNYAKIVFACNELPRVYDLNPGFWSRWVLLEFPYMFLPQKEIDLKSDEEKVRCKLQDPLVIDKITTPEELSGLLNKALTGLTRLKKNKDFSYTQGTASIKNFWIRNSDSFTAFCLDFFEEDANNWIPKKTIRKTFSKYCKQHKLKGTSDKNIKIVLENMFGVVESRKGDKHEQEYVWEGVRFKEGVSI